jgi:photosynthetic reaction center cytochrome c subunit
LIREMIVATGTAGLYVISFAVASGQIPQEQKPPIAEEVFKNVQVLKGISVSEFMETMGLFSASLGENCTFCHVEESGGNWSRYADDNGRKQTARRMIAMVSSINKANFGGARMVTCYSCHRGLDRPRVTPSLAELYGPPLLDERDDIPSAPAAPSADTILDKYISALSGAQRLADVTSIVANGNYQGFAETEKSAMEIYAQGPDKRALIVHTPNGDSITNYDGRNGWTAAPETDRPVTLLPLSGGSLDAARLDALLTFPAQIKQAFTQWRVGFPTMIDGRSVQVVQGRNVGSPPVQFFFDRETGLLLRLVRYSNTALGLSPTQIDYSDYREIAGIKLPFRWIVTWLDGRSSIELTEVAANVSIDATKFARPAAPKPSSSR